MEYSSMFEKTRENYTKKLHSAKYKGLFKSFFTKVKKTSYQLLINF